MSGEERRFSTGFWYSDRQTKACYVWQKYQSVLNGRILDVGADECFLRDHLPPDAGYVGIGLSGNPDRRVDLEKEKIPFNDNSFDCVLCLDVLEHTENIHEVFDELCRVSGRYVIVSLPNPWNTLFASLASRGNRAGQPMKYYGLPPEKPSDRHKWFFSVTDAEGFIRYRAGKNGMDIVQLDYGREMQDDAGFTGKNKKILRFPVAKYIGAWFLKLRYDDLEPNLSAGSVWAVLEKTGREQGKCT